MSSEGTEALDVLPVTADRLDDVAELFASHAATRGCWCMWFIDPAKDVQAGWSTGGNRARFEARTRSDGPPMGLLAYRAGRPVGWIAVGPRSRYERAIGPRTRILRDRDPSEDDDVWLVPCFFVRVGERGRGVTDTLLEAAVAHARDHGATAIEGFPITDQAKGNEFLGREHRFAACGFECIARPSPQRAVMRRELQG